MTNLDFQHLLLLYCRGASASGAKNSGEQLYEFVPHKLGAFSFSSCADRRKLVKNGLLLDDGNCWVLSEAGKSIAKNGESVTLFAQRHRRLRGRSLIAESYRNYPYYAILSKFAGSILEGDSAALRKIRREREKLRSNPLLLATIGYEGRSLDAYLNLLVRSGTAVLCDVRKNAISRKYGFSKSSLAKACEGIGVRYEHMPELGIESKQRRGLKGRADFESLFARYRQSTLPHQTAALRKIFGRVESGESVALTCFERDPSMCHRHCVASALESMAGAKDSPRIGAAGSEDRPPTQRSPVVAKHL